jgi:hypothetical protein
MKKARIISLIVCIALVPLGLSTKWYTGYARLWVNNSLGGVVYELFWCFVLFFINPSLSPKRIALVVFLVTSVLETLQLWNPDFLHSIRSTFFGAALLGTTFVWTDFFYYAVGCGLGWLGMKGIVKISKC